MDRHTLSFPKRLGLALAGALMVAVAFLAVTPRAHASGLGNLDGLHVSGNRLLNGSAATVQLKGVNYAGPEYACIQGWGIFDGPNDAASVAALASWGVTLVRLPLNEDCWLGINGSPAAYSGANYQNAIKAYVDLLHAQGIHAELSLIWGAPGTNKATYQPGAPDADHSPAFWASLAAAYAGDTWDILAPWGETVVNAGCFLNGGVCEATYGPANTPYNTAGMAQAVSTMRAAGYTGVISIPGIDYANNLTQWLSHKPMDPLGNLVAEAHVYGNNTCGAQNGGACLVSQNSPVAAQVPVLLGELGETYDDSSLGTANTKVILDWADSVGASYAAWTWNTWGTPLSLISDFAGTPHGAYGAYVKSRLGGPAPLPTPSATATPLPSTVTPTPSSTPVPPTPTPPPPTPTPQPSPPPTGGSLHPLQSVSKFIDYAGVTPTDVDFAKAVGTGHLLVAIVAIAGGNPYYVDKVTDDLKNTWTKVGSGVNGDNTDVEIWYTNSTASGLDGVYAALIRAPGPGYTTFAQSYTTVVEFDGAGTPHSFNAQESTGKIHGSGSFSVANGDTVIGGYADAGYIGSLSISDGKSVLGQKFDGIDAIQAIQSVGTASGTIGSVTFQSTVNGYSEVLGAAFTPLGAPSPGPSPTPTPLAISNTPCTVVLNGVSVSGRCSGTFTPK